MRTAINKQPSTTRARKSPKDDSLLAEYAPRWGIDPNDPRPRWAQTLDQLLAFTRIKPERLAEVAGEARTTMYLRLGGKRTRLTEEQFRAMELATHPEAPVGLIQTMLPEEAIAWVKERYPSYGGEVSGSTTSNAAKSRWTMGLMPPEDARLATDLVPAA